MKKGLRHELECIRISDIRLATAPAEDVDVGLLGWIACTLNGSLRLEGITLRRTLEGRLSLSFPARRDGAGRQHFYVRPVSDRARLEIEHQVLKALGYEGSS